jgi:hypothetical protein
MSFNLQDYETVEERLIKFWKDYPDGQIHTELIEATTNRFIVFTKLYRTENDARPWTTGLAFETITERGVNATSALENCETSSIGRALASAGYATKGKRPSREEMSKVVRDKIIKVEKPSDPWTVETKEMPVLVAEAVTQLNDGIVPEQIPTCPTHNLPCEPKEGISKYNKPWKHYRCPNANNWQDKCEYVIWYEIDKAGRWVPQRPKPQQGALS